MKFLYLTTIFLLTSTFSIFGQCNPVVDSLVLVKIFNECDGSKWTNNSNWNVPGRKISTWYGIKLNTEGCVESIILPNNKLNGILPDSMGLLKDIKILSMPNNRILSLPFENQFNRLTKLEEINFSQNVLVGVINQYFKGFENLKILNLGVNNLYGDLPNDAFNDLKSLQTLRLNQNKFSGNLPGSIGSLSNVEEILLSQNEIKGNIPSEIGQLTKLKTLILSQNQLSGNIPTEIGLITELRDLFLDENQLSGTIPDAIGNLSQIRELWLSKNQLAGSIPNQLANLTRLRILLLNNNLLTGNIPTFIGNLTDLVSLNMSANQLSGNIPQSLGNLNNLLSLILSDNKLSGVIPETITNLSNLGTLNLSTNQLSGELPSSMGKLTKLRRIYMQNNLLEGCFPKSMKIFCTLGENTNTNANGYNFRQNPTLIFQGDFGRWCNKEGWAIAQINSNAPICEGSELEMIGSGGVDFNWSGPDGFSSSLQNFKIDNISLSQFGEYKLEVINEYRCRDTIAYIVKPVSNVSSSTDLVICEGDDIKLSASGGISYLWTGPNGFSSTASNPTINNATQAMEGEYVVEIKTSDCTITRKVKIEFLKTGSIISDTKICEGETLILDVDGGNTFLWTGPLGFTSSLKSPQINNITIANTGKYAVTIKNNDNCSFTLETEIQVLPKPNPILLDQTPKCVGSSIILSVSPFQSYAWTGPSGFLASVQSPMLNNISEDGFGVYTVIVTDQNGCSAATSQTISRVTEPTAYLSGVACEGSTIQLFSQGGSAYSWTGPMGFVSNLATPEINNITSQMSGIYTVSVQTTDCKIEKNITLDVIRLPIISSNLPLCIGDTLNLSIESGEAFSWSGPSNFVSTIQNPEIKNITKSNEGIYQAKITKAGCSFDIQYEVSLRALRKLNLPDFTGLCNNDDAIVLPSQIEGVDGVWSGNGVNTDGLSQYFDPTALTNSQKLLFTPSPNNYCVDKLDKTINVTAISLTAIESSPSLNFDDSDGKVAVNISSNGFPVILTYSGPFSGTIIVNENENTIEKLKSGQYILTAQDINGCIAIDTVDVRYLKPFYFLPNIVSSNPSSPNHSFYLKGSNVYTYRLQIYSRWGSLMFDKSKLQINEQEQGWFPDERDSGVYVYLLTLDTETGPIVLNGTVTVL